MGEHRPGEGFSISAAAADLLGEQCGVNLHVAPFELPHVGYTDQQRRERAAQVLADLDQRGLAYRSQLEPEVREALVLLGRAPVAAWMMLATRSGKGQAVARVASNGRHAVLAVQQGQDIAVDYVRPTGAVAALMGLVRDRWQITGRSITFPADSPASDGVSASGYGQERRWALAIARRVRGRAGTVVIVGRDRHGRERHGSPLVWHDTDIGRYMIYRTVGADGHEWVSYSPANNARITQKLEQRWAPHDPGSQ